MEYIKLQIGCLAVIFFIFFSYVRELKRDGIIFKKRSITLFTSIIITSIAYVFFDGLTSYSVNHLDTISRNYNLVFHLLFFVFVVTMTFLTFLYILSIADGFSNTKFTTILLCIPYIISLIILFSTFRTMEFIEGDITNYSMGFSVYSIFVFVGLYVLFTIITFLIKWKYIEKRKRTNIFIYTMFSIIIPVIQLIFPEVLISALAPTIFVLGIYINHEEPAVKKLEVYHKDTVVDFATLVENRDNNTGGHIKRTTAYVRLILKELRAQGYYKDLLTRDFINNLEMAAPMHDIGKISAPDAILQKTGKLTDEEFDVMKRHSENGAKIIQETFGKHGKEDFINTAYEVALYHHEKWNGKGYPLGLKEDQIPLSARIMAIADVFDAISQKRCYRDAMPLDQCFEIIQKGRAWDFDPLLVDIFLDIRPKVEKVYSEIYG